jgi:hypothetical protein
MGNFLNTRNISPDRMKNGPISLNWALSANRLKSDELDRITNKRNAMEVTARNLKRK